MEPNQITPAQANILARQMLTTRAVKRTQSIFNKVIDTSAENRLQIPPRNTGLILGFIVNVTSTVTVGAAGTALTRTPWGASNAVSNFTFLDLNNNTRIQTTGWHLGLLNSTRAARPYGGVDAFENYPVAYGDYLTGLYSAPATIAQGASAEVAFTYYVPLAYSDKDLRGAQYGNVVNANMSLNLDLNSRLVAARTDDNWHGSVYCTANAATQPADIVESNVNVEVLQVYYDQLPTGNSGVILPAIDLQTIYELKNTSVTGIASNNDFPIAYSNFRDFLSTATVFRNGQTANGFGNPTSISEWKLQSANYTDIFDVRQKYAGLWNRMLIGQDLPESAYMFSSREKPISTVQYGNMNLVLDANTVAANAQVNVGFEAFALTNVIGQAGSLTPGA